MLAGWDANPNRFVEGTFPQIVKGLPVVLGAVGVGATLLEGELVRRIEFIAVVLAVFERDGFRLPLGSFLLLDFGVHSYLFSDRLQPIYIEIL